MVREAGIARRLLAALALSLLASVLNPAARAASVGSSPLPYQSDGKHLGVATCASSVCHGSVVPASGHDVRLDEFVTWSHSDKHSQAYGALSSEKGKAISARLGIGDARTDNTCLGCHADNVPVQRRGPGFSIADGVSCEACHGGANAWLASHHTRGASHTENLARGMYPTDKLGDRARLCMSCHIGNEDKFATHRIMGAGHPRLAIELDTFLALEPPHYQVDEDYAKRKPVYSHTQVWVLGQLAAAQAQLTLLQGPLVRQQTFMPELALLDCHACHENPMHRADWSRDALTRMLPAGSVPFADGHLKMALVIARALDPGQANKMMSRAQALQKASAQGREQVLATSAQLAESVARAIDLAESHAWSEAERRSLMRQIVESGAAGEYGNYISAEQAVMALELLMIDAGVAARYRDHLDQLYRILHDDDAYKPALLRESLSTLATAIRSGAP
jgi:hypothetical protein